MYKLLLTLFIFLGSPLSWGFDKDFKTTSDRIPHEFNLMFESLKGEITNPSEKILMIGICKDLDNNLGFLTKEHVFMLMKTEVIKNVMEFKFNKIRQFEINTDLIQHLEADLKKKEKTLNRFSQWIWRSIIAELQHRKAMGLISNKNFSVRNFQGAKLTEAIRFEKYLRYLIPWIDKMDGLSAEDFNSLSKEVSWTILNRLNERSQLFHKLAHTAESDTKVTLFNIPQKLIDLSPQQIKLMLSDSPEPSLKERSETEKNQAREAVSDIAPDDMSTISDDVSKELEKKTEKTQ